MRSLLPGDDSCLAGFILNPAGDVKLAARGWLSIIGKNVRKRSSFIKIRMKSFHIEIIKIALANLLSRC